MTKALAVNLNFWIEKRNANYWNQYTVPGYLLNGAPKNLNPGLPRNPYSQQQDQIRNTRSPVLVSPFRRST